MARRFSAPKIDRPHLPEMALPALPTLPTLEMHMPEMHMPEMHMPHMPAFTTSSATTPPRRQGQAGFAYLETHLPESERQEALVACGLARDELQRFIAAPAPSQSALTQLSLFGVVMLRPFLAPFVGNCFERLLPISEFMLALLQLGGIERASVMLAICRFDTDQSGTFTDGEYRVFQDGAKELLRHTVS